MSLSEARQAYDLTVRLIEGFVRITRFLAGGPLVALPAEPDAEPPDRLRVWWLRVAAVLLLAFFAFELAADLRFQQHQRSRPHRDFYADILGKK